MNGALLLLFNSLERHLRLPCTSRYFYLFLLNMTKIKYTHHMMYAIILNIYKICKILKIKKN